MTSVQAPRRNFSTEVGILSFLLKLIGVVCALGAIFPLLKLVVIDNPGGVVLLYLVSSASSAACGVVAWSVATGLQILLDIQER